VVKSVHTLVDTPARLAGAEFEIGKWIWVDHKAGYFVPYRIAAWRFDPSLDSLNTERKPPVAPMA
jgi:hypothetical protein